MGNSCSALTMRGFAGAVYIESGEIDVSNVPHGRRWSGDPL
jgi:hypothetical protein